MPQSQTQPQNRAAEFAQQPAFNKESTTNSATAAATTTTTTTPPSPHSNDILLNNFQIKKKRYRVLLNCDHLVWERLNAQQSSRTEDAKSKKETEYEKEQLSNRAAYGSASHVVHIDDIICADTSHSKAPAVVRPATPNADVLVAEQQPTTHTAPHAAQYLNVHYAERIVKSATDCNRWHVRTLTLFNSDPYIVRQWHSLLVELLQHSARCHVQRLLVFINPYGGRKQALPRYERYCKPLFQLAGIDASCIISQRANQVRDILLSHDLTPYDAICCVGGDGTVAEVINGLLFRSMRDQGMDRAIPPERIPKPQLPFGVIPAGSTDTVAYSMHGTADVATAAIHLVLGQRRGLDVCSVSNRQGIVRFCASMFSYGYLGDVAARSEHYRWMGPKRYEYAGVKSFLRNRGYEAELRVLLSDKSDVELAQTEQTEQTHSTGVQNESDTSMNTNVNTICYANCSRCNLAVPSPSLKYRLTCDTPAVVDRTDAEVPSSSKLSLEDHTTFRSLEETEKVDNHGKELGSIYNETEDVDNKRNLNLTDCDKNAKALTMHTQLENNSQQIKELLNGEALFDSTDNGCAVELTQESTSDVSTPPNWKLIKGKFFMICGANITCACSRSPNGMSRYNHLGDGCLELILVRSTSLCNNVRLLINTMGRNGDLRNLPFVEVYRAQRFVFRTPYFEGQEEEHSIRGSCQPIVDPSSSGVDDDERVSRWNCDGEVVNDLEITMSSHCQLVDVFMRGPYAYTKPTRSDKGVRFCCCSSDN